MEHFGERGSGERMLVADWSRGLQAQLLTSALAVGMSGGAATLNDGMAVPVDIIEVVFAFFG